MDINKYILNLSDEEMGGDEEELEDTGTGIDDEEDEEDEDM